MASKLHKKVYQAIVKGSIDRAVPFDIDYEIDGKEAKTIVTKTLPEKKKIKLLSSLKLRLAENIKLDSTYAILITQSWEILAMVNTIRTMMD